MKSYSCWYMINYIINFFFAKLFWFILDFNFINCMFCNNCINHSRVFVYIDWLGWEEADSRKVRISVEKYLYCVINNNSVGFGPWRLSVCKVKCLHTQLFAKAVLENFPSLKFCIKKKIKKKRDLSKNQIVAFVQCLSYWNF